MSILTLTRQLLTDTSLPYIIVDMIALHTRVDRKPLHSLRNSSANGVGTATSSVDRQKHTHGCRGVHTTCAPCSILGTACPHARTAPLGLHPVTKIKTTKISCGSYFRLFMKIGTTNITHHTVCSSLHVPNILI